jgi:formate dehydrogenase subunit beta
MTVCPICYCKECFFESPTFDLESDKYFQMAEHKGALRLPSNMTLFHITRFNHMVLSCVACGMCEQGCPADIPLLSIYKAVGKNAQTVFDYEPGRSLEEEIPILTFKEDELEPR